MNGADSQERITKAREELEDLAQRTQVLRKEIERVKFLERLTICLGALTAALGLGYFVYVAIWGMK